MSETLKFDPKAFMESDVAVNGIPDPVYKQPEVNENVNNDEVIDTTNNQVTKPEDVVNNNNINENVNENPISFDDDWNEIETEEIEEEFNPDDYKAIEKLFNVKIETKEDLEQFQQSQIKKEEKPKEDFNSQILNDEEYKQVDLFTNALNQLENSTPEEIYGFYLKQTDSEKYSGEEGQTEIEFKIETLKEAEAFDEVVNQIKLKYIQDVSSKRKAILDEAEKRNAGLEQKTKSEIQSALKSFKDGFHGINIDANKMAEIYKNINNNKIFDEIESTQANVAEMGVLWSMRDVIYKILENPSTSPGIKLIMDDLQNAKPKQRSGKSTLKNPYKFDPSAFINAEVDVKQ